MAEQSNPYIDANLIQAQKDFNPSKNKQFTSQYDSGARKYNQIAIPMPVEYRPSFSSGVYGCYSLAILKPMPAEYKPSFSSGVYGCYMNYSIPIPMPAVYVAQTKVLEYFQRDKTKTFEVKTPYQFNITSFLVEYKGRWGDRGWSVDVVKRDEELFGIVELRGHDLADFDDVVDYKTYYKSISIRAVGLWLYKGCLRTVTGPPLKLKIPIHASNDDMKMQNVIRKQREKEWKQREKEEKIQESLRQKERIRQEKIKNSYVDSHLQHKIDEIQNTMAETDTILTDAISELQQMLGMNQSEEKQPL
eukprot:409294_1